jgi:hypothetical protein
MTGPLRGAVLAVALAAVLVGVGCSRAVEGTPSAADGGAPPATSPRPAPPSTSATAAPDPVELLRPALLEPADVGPGFTLGEEPVPDPSGNAACGGPGVVAQFPDAQRVGVAMDGPVEGIFVQELVSAYGAIATADAAFEATVAGLDCSEGSLGPLPVVITPAEDLQFDVGGDRALGWQIGSDGLDIVLVTAQVQDVIVAFVFAAPVDTDPVALPDRLALARLGVDRIASVLR